MSLFDYFRSFGLCIIRKIPIGTKFRHKIHKIFGTDFDIDSM